MLKVNVEIANVFTGHSEAVYCLEKGIQQFDFYSGSADGFVGLWNTDSGTFEKPLAKVNSSIYALKLLAPSTLLIGEQSGVLNAIDMDSKVILKSIQLTNSNIFTIALLPANNSILVGDGGGNIHVLNEDFEVIQILNLCNANIRKIDISPCGRFVVVGASDHQIYFLEWNGLLELRQVLAGHTNSVFSVQYKSPYSLLSGGRDAMLNEWKWNEEEFLNTQKWSLHQTLPAHNFTINSIAIQPNQMLFATSSRDKSIKIWNYQTNELLKVIDTIKFPGTHTHSVNSILWLDNQTLLSTGDDKKIISWTIQNIPN
jgi:WD40 repeat protein